MWVEWRDDERELETDDRRVKDFRSRVEGLARRSNSKDSKLDWYQLLTQWEIQLRQIEDSRQMLVRLQQELEEKRKRLLQTNEQLSGVRSQRARATGSGRCNRPGQSGRQAEGLPEVQRTGPLHAVAQEELATAAKLEADMAVVEEDLLRLIPHRTMSTKLCCESNCCRSMSSSNSSTRSSDGSSRRSSIWRTIAGPPRSSSSGLNWLTSSNRSVDSWLALKATAQTVEQMRSRVERSCQPEILKHASAHLDRLTLGKYHNIWTPLDSGIWWSTTSTESL